MAGLSHLLIWVLGISLVHCNPLETYTVPDGCTRAVLDCPWLTNENDITVHLPHDTDCDRFCQCDLFGRVHDMPCAPGTVFNPAIEVCDHPENVNCAENTPSTSTTTTTETPDPPPVVPTPPAGCTAAAADCPWLINENDITVHLPHDTDCDRFCQCDLLGVVHDMPCAPGTLFNPELQVCDWPHNVDCNGATSPEPPTTTTTTETPDPPSPVPTPPAGCAAAAADCPWLTNENDITVHLPHDTDCDRFCQCDLLGVVHDMPCAPGTLFNPELQVCDWPHNVDCNGATSPEPPTTTTTTETPDPPSPVPTPPAGCTTAAADCPWLTNENDITVHLPHDTDCDRFCQCDLLGVVHDMPCAPGTLFNPVLQVCDWPHNVDCNGATSPEPPTTTTTTETPDPPSPVPTPPAGCAAAAADCPWLTNENDITVHLPHDTDCDRFCQCDLLGVVHDMPCAPGTLFNPELQVCDWPHNVDCNGATSPEPPTTTTTTETPDPPSSVPTPPAGCTAAAADCPWLTNENDITVHLPHDTDCDRFCQCDLLGVVHDMPCAPGTLFNPVLQVCDWPHNVDCNGATSPEPPTTTTTTETPDPPSPVPTPPAGCAAAAADCPWLTNENDITVHLPHDTDCDRFCQCDLLGVVHDMPCAPGTLFNPVLQVCDWPHNVDCNGATSPEPPTTTTTTETPDPPSPVPTPPAGCAAAAADCPWLTNENDITVHLPHDTDCDRFCQCDLLGVVHDMPCAPGTLFNPNLQVCDWPHNVDCNGATSPEPSTSTTTTETPDPPSPVPTPPAGCAAAAADCPWLTNENDITVHLPHDTDCDRFCQCDLLGVVHDMPCAPGTLFNPELQVCDWPHNVDCNGATSPEPPTTTTTTETPDPPSPVPTPPAGCAAAAADCPWLTNENDITVHLPHDTDCDRFCQCDLLGVVHDMPCAPGTLFNPVLQVCDWPHNVDCNGATSPEPPTTTTTTEAPDPPSSVPTPPAGCTAAAADCPWLTNENDITVHLPHDTDCDRFCQCDLLGVVHDMPCAPGTLFNPVLQVCDHPENVNCNGATSPEPPTTTTTTTTGAPPTADGCSRAEAECPWLDSADDITVHLPHDRDCDKFCQCDLLGRVHEMPCAPGTLFNAALQVCDHPENVVC